MSVEAGTVDDNFRSIIENAERSRLSDLAVGSFASGGRRYDEAAECSLRTPFQVDRDRILHTKAFRRLMSKTQVFIAPEGDHYRTRLTHTLEVTAISRTIARALRLNEDLTEAIGLGHDLGHPPFGHTGEHALDAALSERFGRRFLHNEQSLRMVDVLERNGRGLNLTNEVRNGILCHTGEQEPRSLEAKIVRLADRIAYLNHDIDDALRAQMLRWSDLPQGPLAVLGDTGSKRIDRLVHDVVATSEACGDIVQSDEVGSAMLNLRSFMFERVYLDPRADGDRGRVMALLPRLLDHYIEHPELVPELPGAAARGDDLPQRITDYIAGMTDRFCLRVFRDTFLPHAWNFPQ